MNDRKFEKMQIKIYPIYNATVAAGRRTVILQANGTAVAAGDNTCGQCQLGNWNDIISVAAGNNSHRQSNISG